MSVVKIIEISCEGKSIEEAMQAGVAEASKTLKNIIPESGMNLDLDSRESSRGSTIVTSPILEIWGKLRSLIPGALAQSKFQVDARLWYTLFKLYLKRLRKNLRRKGSG